MLSLWGGVWRRGHMVGRKKKIKPVTTLIKTHTIYIITLSPLTLIKLGSSPSLQGFEPAVLYTVLTLSPLTFIKLGSPHSLWGFEPAVLYTVLTLSPLIFIKLGSPHSLWGFEPAVLYTVLTLSPLTFIKLGSPHSLWGFEPAVLYTVLTLSPLTFIKLGNPHSLWGFEPAVLYTVLTLSPLTFIKLGSPHSLWGFEPAVLYTGCFTRSGLMASLLFGKQPNCVISLANMCSIACVSCIAFDHVKRQKKYQHWKADHAVSPHKQVCHFCYHYCIDASYWTSTFAVETDNKLSLCTDKYITYDAKYCLSKSKSLLLWGKSHLSLRLLWISFFYSTCWLKDKNKQSRRACIYVQTWKICVSTVTSPYWIILLEWKLWLTKSICP